MRSLIVFFLVLILANSTLAQDPKMIGECAAAIELAKLNLSKKKTNFIPKNSHVEKIEDTSRSNTIVADT